MLPSSDGPQPAKPMFGGGLPDDEAPWREWPGDELRLFAGDAVRPPTPRLDGLEPGILAFGDQGPLGQIAYLDWEPLTGDPLQAVLVNGQHIPIGQLIDPETCTFLFVPAQETELAPQEGRQDPLI